MKMILAFIQPHRLDRVIRALQHVEGFPGVTVSEAKGFGREKLQGPGDARDQLTDFTPRTRLESVVSEEMAPAVVTAIVDAAHTGKGGDGALFEFSVDRGVRIKTKRSAHEND